jgi:REP element-mobilizing transposase RayT
MARSRRLKLAGARYHITSRGHGHEDNYLSDDDRLAWLETLAHVCERFNWVCHAWCQMSNHYHLVVETPQANLSPKHERDETIALAYLSGQHTMAAITGHFGVHDRESVSEGL